MAQLDNRPTFAFEHVAAKLEPFDLMRLAFVTGSEDTRQQTSEKLQLALSGPLGGAGADVAAVQSVRSQLDGIRTPRGRSSDEHALAPIFATGGLVFPYNPTVSEKMSVKYDAVELTHSNESYHVYRSTDNVRISISEAVWTCDTFANAVYALSVIHFLRTYSQMDFGRNRTGRPPSPMWFSAFGNYAFHRVPVLLESADWSFPSDVDYVGIPEFGTPEHASGQLRFERTPDGNYTWLPMVFKIPSIQLIVQHSPRYWINYSLDDFRSGKMLRDRKSFHVLPGNTNRRK